MNGEAESALADFVLGHKLAEPGEPMHWTRLTGGVSSDLWRVELPGRSLCVKRALARLNVAADWHAPLSRNAAEWAWLRYAARHIPGNVPQVLAHDPDAGLFAMSYLPPERYPVWKTQLMAGRVDPGVADAVGRTLGRLHAVSAGDAAVAREFANDENFEALRIEPYLRAVMHAHPDLADVIAGLADRTAETRTALVHGDVSPKNILVGPDGPVLLDAECAWYGDPAFDLAFCLNHLLLKCLPVRAGRVALRESAQGLARAYFAEVARKASADLEYRVATLLPALLLARVDGKSPVEYLTSDDRDFVRQTARTLLGAPPPTIAAVLDHWHAALSRRRQA